MTEGKFRLPYFQTCTYHVDVVKNTLWRGTKEGYKPYYAKISNSSRASPNNIQMPFESKTNTCNDSTLDNGDSTTSDLFAQILIADN